MKYYIFIILINRFKRLVYQCESQNDRDDDPSGLAVIYNTLIILWIITLSSVSQNEAINHGLYDYWRYGLNRIIVLGIIIGIALILCCCVPICSELNNGLGERGIIIVDLICPLCTWGYLISTLVFTYYLITTNDNANDLQYHQTGDTFLDMMQILSFISIIIDYLITIPIVLGGCITSCGCINVCFCGENPIIISCCKSSLICIKNSFVFVFQKIKEFCKCNIVCSCMFSCGNVTVEPHIPDNSQITIVIENEPVPQLTNPDSVQNVTENTCATCAICLNDISEDKTILQCKHVFCTECIDEWKKKKNTCPYCRNNF